MSERERLGREPFEWIEIDQDFCSLTYGTAPCTASLATGGRKCFNTRVTCQDPANYDLSTLTLRFCKNQAVMPSDAMYRPSVASIRTSSAQLNPGGANANSSALGVRSGITVTFNDHPDPDRLVDPYITDRDYDPFTRSTFWAKWRARNPYYMHRVLRYKTGYLVDGEIDADTVVTRTYFITGFDGPSASGSVTITAKDVLILAANDKATYPALSEGKLSAGIDDSVTSATLTPAGIGNLSYPASGYVCIGDEVCAFTRSGDNLTLTRRQFNTTAAEHDADDLVQLCGYFDGASPQDILYTLLSEGAGISDTYLDTDGWDTEVLDYMPRVYGRLIPKPVGVSKLVAEITEQMGFAVWFDERDGLVKMRAVRPAEDEQVTDLSSDRHQIADSVRWRDLADQLVTQVRVYYGLINPTEDSEDPSNYAVCDLITDEDAAGQDRNRGHRIKTVYASWIAKGSGASAQELGNRLLERYGSIPRECTFEVDAKDGELWLGDFVRLSNRLVVDDEGNQLPVNIQIYTAEEAVAGHRFRYSGQQFTVQTPLSSDERPKRLSGDFYSINLRELHDEEYGAPVGGETVVFTITSGSRIGGLAAGLVAVEDLFYEGEIFVPGNGDTTVTGTLPIITSQSYSGTYARNAVGPDGTTTMRSDARFHLVGPSIVTGDWPEGVTLKLIIEPGAYVLGQGGSGGVHYGQDGSGNEIHFPGDGGHALEVTYPISIDNQGVIACGFAGGGGFVKTPVTPTEGIPSSFKLGAIIPGGGGRGWPGGRTVTIIQGNVYTGFEVDAQFGFQSQPSAGTHTAGGVSGSMSGESISGSPSVFGGYTYQAISGQGGRGTGLGESAGAAIFRRKKTLSGGYTQIGTSYGDAGANGDAIHAGAALITWINKGSVIGAENS